MQNKDVKALLKLLDFPLPRPTDYPKDYTTLDVNFAIQDAAVAHLMNMTLQCLGAIRTIVVESEKGRIALDCTDVDGSQRDSGRIALIQKQVFQRATAVMTSAIITGREIDALDPMKPLVESFPWAPKLQHNQWLMLNWSLIDAPTAEEIRNDPDSQKDYMHQIRNVLRYYPDTISEVDKFGQHYMKYAVSSHSMPVLEELLSYHRNSTKLRDGYGKLPFHYAAGCAQSVETVLVISQHMGKSIEELSLSCYDDFGNLPIHVAAGGSCALEVLKEILFCYPDGVKMANNDQQFPLHLAASGNDLTKVKQLFSAFPPAISCPDKRGMLPVHQAAMTSKNPDILQFLTEQFPDAIKAGLSVNGRLPIHYATVNCQSTKVLQWLVKEYPEGAAHMDNNQRLPLHNLIARCEYWTPARLRCLRLLLEYYPQGAGLSDRGGLTPLDIARRDGHGDQVIRLLLRADPTQDPEAIGEMAYLASKGKYADRNKNRRGRRAAGSNDSETENTYGDASSTQGGGDDDYSRYSTSDRGTDYGTERGTERGTEAGTERSEGKKRDEGDRRSRRSSRGGFGEEGRSRGEDGGSRLSEEDWEMT